MKTLPNITNKQQELIRLIYRHRFVQREQLQAFLHHSEKRRVSAWLKDLREKEYIEWIYEADDPVQSKTPAVYYLGLGGIRFLKTVGEYPMEELRKRYAEGSRKQTFIDRCLLLADCCIDMESTTARDDNRSYSYVTEADYLDPDNHYSFLAESEYVRPDLCYEKQQDTGEDDVTTDTLLQVIDATLPRYSLKKRLLGYIEFLGSGEWEECTDGRNLPVIALVCPTKADFIYAKRKTIQLLKEQYGDGKNDIPETIHIRFSYVTQIRKLGVTGKAWEEA
jgi:hypothetical protein